MQKILQISDGTMHKLGKYQIIERIGVGGFGEVFKGYDPFIKRHVAVKTCNSQDEEIRHRFFQEAEIAGNLHHRNITTVYDFGIQDGLPYLIQEYLSGEDLHHKIKRRDFLPYPEKLYYLIQVARGQAYAHAKGVIHRDIKPANIRVLEDGTAKIMDFGIAKLAMQDTGLTKTGMTVGTAAYLAPEQIRGDAVACQTDIFAFGATAYELLTYERPFQGEQISAILYQTLNVEPKAIVDYWPSAPEDIVRVIHRCLRKDPNERFADGRKLLSALEQVQGRGRLSRSSSTGTLSSAVLAATTPMHTQPVSAGGAVAQGSSEEKTVVRAASRPRLDDVDLSASRTAGDANQGTTTPTKRDGSLAAAAPSGRGRTALLLFSLVLIAGVIGWWFGTRQQGESAEALESVVVDSAPGMPSTLSELPAKEHDQPPPSASDAGSAREGDEAASGTADAPPPIAEVEEAAPPPPPLPPPEPAVVSFEAIPWTEHARLRLGSKTYRLPTRQSLPPGSYQATFFIEEEAYSDSQAVRFTVEAGQQLNLRSELVEPGRINVRAGLHRPQGRVKIDDQAIDQSPLKTGLLKAGTYRLEIESLDGTNRLVIDAVEVRSGQMAIVAFDLTGGTHAINFRPLAEEGE